MGIKRAARMFVLLSEQGLNLLFASLLARETARFKSDIVIGHGNRVYPAKKILGVLSMEVSQGDVFTVAAEGPDATDAMRAVLTWSRACAAEVSM